MSLSLPMSSECLPSMPDSVPSSQWHNLNRPAHDTNYPDNPDNPNDNSANGSNYHRAHPIDDHHRHDNWSHRPSGLPLSVPMPYHYCSDCPHASSLGSAP
eukprot:TRINITY_DN2802_c1_g1::TRINITY_DN2802_c1_g1_i1::g.5931::m.5931 TRINITY_DN2802_c1_g1::TRINITY_DN2802_c1_g1_i1::g.5931  ORF type:complete len:100 (-),score=6.11 TRINITY_DN2802_c1_g1_i1:289-588(-)